MRKDRITDELLADYLLGETTVAQTLLVENWVKASASNKAYFEQFRQAWQVSKHVLTTHVAEDQAWTRLQKRLASGNDKKIVPITSSFTRVGRIAAILLLCLGVGAVIYTMNSNSPVQPVAEVKAPSPTPAVPITVEAPKVQPVATVQAISKEEPPKEPKVTKQKSQPVEYPKPPANKYDLARLADDCKTKGEICNGTPCPLEICIIQKDHCDKGHAYPISNCSILDPDRSGQLCYKGWDEQKHDHDCKLQVEEIRITRLSTGETIVLDAHSDVTAQEFFSYITGQKQGEVTAGVFTTDCNNRLTEDGLSMDNSFGSLHFR